MTREEKIREARRLRALGWTSVAIGGELGVSDSTVRNWYLGGDCTDCGAPITYDSATETPQRCASCEIARVAVTEHGTLPMYRKGCGCDACRQANSTHQRTILGRVPPHHGYSGYRNYGCRCDICRAGHNEKARQHYARKRAAA